MTAPALRRYDPPRDPQLSQMVRTIGRLGQTLFDLRQEYERRPHPDTLTQIDRRLGELLALRTELNARQMLAIRGEAPPARSA